MKKRFPLLRVAERANRRTCTALLSGAEAGLWQPKMLCKQLFNAMMVSLILLICGCAATPSSVPTSSVSRYAEFPVGPDVFRVVYREGSSVSADQNLDLTLLRAAQLTREQHFSCFAVIDEDASATGQMVYVAGLNHFELKPNRGLLIKCFESKPHRVFSFNAKTLENALNEKLHLN